MDLLTGDGTETLKLSVRSERTGHDSARLVFTRPNGSTLTVSLPSLETPDDPDDATSVAFRFQREVVDRVGLPLIVQVNGYGQDVEHEPESTESYGSDESSDVVDFDGDDAIAFLGHVLRTDDESSEVVAIGAGGYWTAHDIVHAIDDLVPDDRYTGESRYRLTVDDSDEDAALVNGAILALAVGVPLADVVGTVARIGPRFKERFRTDSVALERLLSKLSVTVPNASDAFSD